MDRQIEQGRLARAVHLDCERIADHVYRVRGHGHEHLVDLASAEECGCEDYRYRSGLCCHVLSAMLMEGNRDVIRSLRALLPLPGGRRLVRAA